MAMPGIFHIEGAVLGASGVAINVIADLYKSAFISGIIRNQGFGKMEFLLKEAIGLNRIKSGITKEDIGVKTRVQGKEIGEYRF